MLRYEASKGRITLLIIENGIKLKQKLSHNQLNEIAEFLRNITFYETLRYY